VYVRDLPHSARPAVRSSSENDISGRLHVSSGPTGGEKKREKTAIGRRGILSRQEVIYRCEMAGSTARTALYEPAVLYEDSFVRVSESDVAVKRFFFPFGTRKVIAGADVASVQNAATLDVLRIGQCKRWGMALNNIW